MIVEFYFLDEEDDNIFLEINRHLLASSVDRICILLEDVEHHLFVGF